MCEMESQSGGLRAGVVVVAYDGKAAFKHTRQEKWCSGFIQINLEALS